MERLTERHYHADDHYMVCSENCYSDMGCIDCPAFDKLIERLAAYEDTGMEPEEVLPKEKADEIAIKLMRLADLESFCEYSRLLELAEADKEGRVVVLPCKVGCMMLDTTFDDSPAIMKRIRPAILYERIRGVGYHMDFDTFTDLVKHGRIRPVSEEALRERREES